MNGNLDKQSLTIGTFFGVRLRIHYSWLLIFALVAWTVIAGYLPSYYKGLSLPIRIIDGLTVTILFFISVVAHEFAHSLVAKSRGLKIKRITLFLFGGAAELQHEPTDAKTELFMTLAGPATSIAAAVLFGVLWAIGRDTHVSELEIIAGLTAFLNLAVAIFNLLPAYPLDGGRIFRSIIWLRTKDIVSATKTASSVSYFLSYLMIAIGFVEIIYGDVIGGIWLGFIGFFLHQMTRLSYAQTVNQEILKSVKIQDVMDKDFITIPEITSVNEYLEEYVLRYNQYDFLVASDSRLTGIIEINRVMRLGRSKRESPIENYMTPITQDLRLKPQDPVLKVLQVMQRHDVHILPVFSGNKLIGAVTAQHINDYLLVHRSEDGLSAHTASGGTT